MQPSFTYSELQSIPVSEPFSVPEVLFAILLLVAGVLIGSAAKALVQRLFKKSRVDDVLVATGAHTIVERTGYSLDTGTFIGTLLKWFIILFFLDMAFAVFNLQAASTIMNSIVLGYLPRIFVAAAIIFVAFILAHVAQKYVIAQARAVHMHGARTLGQLTRTIILIGAVLATLIQLHIMTEVALMLLAGMIFAMSLAAGIALGYGGKEMVARYLNTLTKGREE